MQSLMKQNDRVCSPSPQISTSYLPASFAIATFRQIAAEAFSRPPSQVVLSFVVIGLFVRSPAIGDYPPPPGGARAALAADS